MNHEDLIGKRIPAKIASKYVQGNFYLTFERYIADQKLCINIIDAHGIPATRLTINISDPLEDDEFHVKNWSENDGLLESLVKSGHIIATGKFSETGFVKAPICRLAESLVSDEAE